MLGEFILGMTPENFRDVIKNLGRCLKILHTQVKSRSYFITVIFLCRFDPEVEGGESLFLDAFNVAEEFRKQFPEQFDNLVRIPGTFQKIHFERYALVCFSLTQNLILCAWLYTANYCSV